MKLKQIKEKFTEITDLKANAANAKKYLKVKKDFRRKDTWQFVVDIINQLKVTPILLSELVELKQKLLIKPFVKLKKFCLKYIYAAENLIEDESATTNYYNFIKYSGLYINDLDIAPATGRELHYSKVSEDDYFDKKNLHLLVSLYPPSNSVEEAIEKAWETYQHKDTFPKYKKLLAPFITLKKGKGWEYIDHRCFENIYMNESQWLTEAEKELPLDKIAEVLINCFELDREVIETAIEKHEATKKKIQKGVEYQKALVKTLINNANGNSKVIDDYDESQYEHDKRDVYLITAPEEVTEPKTELVPDEDGHVNFIKKRRVYEPETELVPEEDYEVDFKGKRNVYEVAY